MVPFGFGHRAIRVSQRPAGCANLYVDQPMIRAAWLIDHLSGDTRYTKALDDYIAYYLKHFINSQTGLLEWGVHISYNVYEECFKSADGHHHEIQGILPFWPKLHSVAPQTIRDYLKQFWYYHTDPKTGIVGRHPEKGDGCSFAMAGGEMVLACAFLYTIEHDDVWLERAKLVAGSHWKVRDPRTNLFPNRLPSLTDNKDRFDLHTGDTSIPGLWCSRVLIAGMISGSDELIQMSRDVLSAWATYGWDENKQLPWAMLHLDGTPVDEPRINGQVYDRQAPKGHWNFWKDYVYGFEYPFHTLNTFAMAAMLSGEEQFLQHCKRLADCFMKLLPPNDGLGTFAGNYGQLISFFNYCAVLTGEEHYRNQAIALAEQAIEKLWTGRIFRGFPAKDRYEAIDGVGHLAQALAELDSDPDRLKTSFLANPFLWNI